MTFTQKLAATIFVSACALSTNVNAHESALEQIVSNIVASGIKNVSNEIEVQLDKTILTVSNNLSLDTAPVPANKVTITDIAKVEVNKQDKDESGDNQNDKADD